MTEMFLINMKLPSLNDVIKKNRENRYSGNNYKKEIEEIIGWNIKKALCSGTLTPRTEPVDIVIDYYELTRKRDVDNIQSSTKFILDALVKNGVLKNDGRKYVNQIYHRIFDIDKPLNDYCYVALMPAGSVELKFVFDK